MNANAPILSESVRIPLHELQADVDYLIGRVIADGSCGAMIATSIKTKLAAIESALTAPMPEREGMRETLDKVEAEARRYAEMYKPNSDGRNTFVIFADWVAALAPHDKTEG